MQTSRLGGSIASADMAVAVMPFGSPPTQMVMTFTVEATRRIACLKADAKIGIGLGHPTAVPL